MYDSCKIVISGSTESLGAYKQYRNCWSWFSKREQRTLKIWSLAECFFLMEKTMELEIIFIWWKVMKLLMMKFQKELYTCLDILLSLPLLKTHLFTKIFIWWESGDGTIFKFHYYSSILLSQHKKILRKKTKKWLALTNSIMIID